MRQPVTEIGYEFGWDAARLTARALDYGAITEDQLPTIARCARAIVALDGCAGTVAVAESIQYYAMGYSLDECCAGVRAGLETQQRAIVVRSTMQGGQTAH